MWMEGFPRWTSARLLQTKSAVMLATFFFPLLSSMPYSSYRPYRLSLNSEVNLVRSRRDFAPFQPFQMQSINFSDSTSSMPTADWNPLSNLKKGGFSSSVSQSHASFTDKKNPSLSIGDSLAVVVDINGPLGDVNSEYNGNQNFGKGVKTASGAKGGAVNGTALALTATKADITGVDPNADGVAISINKANVIMQGNSAANAAAQGSVNTRRPNVAVRATVASVVLVPNSEAPVQKIQPRTTSITTTSTTPTTTTTTIAIVSDYDNSGGDGEDTTTTTTQTTEADSDEDRPRRGHRRHHRPGPEFFPGGSFGSPQFQGPPQFQPQPAFGTFATPSGFNNIQPLNNNFNNFNSFG